MYKITIHEHGADPVEESAAEREAMELYEHQCAHQAERMALMPAGMMITVTLKDRDNRAIKELQVTTIR